MSSKPTIPTPTEAGVKKQLKRWRKLDNYNEQEDCLYKLFNRTYTQNTEMDDVLVKVATLNAFYSTRIFYQYEVAKHIVALNIDERLASGDKALVNDIAQITIDGNDFNFYSFASKYCSHHQVTLYPIYDNYVASVLCHFMLADESKKLYFQDLKTYPIYVAEYNAFIEKYQLGGFCLKDLDHYLWLTGKAAFGKK